MRWKSKLENIHIYICSEIPRVPCKRSPRFRFVIRRRTFTSLPLRYFSVFVYTHIEYKKTTPPCKQFVVVFVIFCVRRLFVHVCEFLGLVGCDAGINDFLDVAVHDLVEFV